MRLFGKLINYWFSQNASQMWKYEMPSERSLDYMCLKIIISRNYVAAT